MRAAGAALRGGFAAIRGHLDHCLRCRALRRLATGVGQQSHSCSLLQMQQRVLAPLYIWWWWLPQRIVASLKRRGWGTWSGTTNLDAGRGGVRAAAHELLERLYIAWWWGPVAPLVSWWKRSFWSGRNNIRANNAGVPWPTPRRRRQQPWPGAAMHLKRRRRPTAGTPGDGGAN